MLDYVAQGKEKRSFRWNSHLHELVVLLWVKLSLQVSLAEGQLLVTRQLLKLFQLLHDLVALQVLQLLELLPLLLFLLKVL